MQLLDVPELRGATVTFDAKGCQREIVKRSSNNQPTLAQAVESAFSD